MEDLKYSFILQENKRLAFESDAKPLRILIVSNVVLETAKDFVEYELRSIGISVEVEMGGYDNWQQDTYEVSHDVLIVWLEPWNLAPAIYCKQASVEANFWVSLEESLKMQIETLIARNKKLPLIVFNTFVPVLDYGYPFQKSAFSSFVQRMNDFLFSLQSSNLIIFDALQLFLQWGTKELISTKKFYAFNSLFSHRYFRIYSFYLKFLFLGLKGKTKKAIIMDCDNTLWKGIVGEDGFQNLSMSYDTAEGRPFFEVQQMLISLAQQGVIVGLCSKNNFSDVDEVINQHPDMGLKDQHIVIRKINWEPKPENLKKIATELNIGLDSIVFWDDNEFEIQMVRKLIPEVLCFKVPDKGYDYSSYFQEQLGWFFKKDITEEDKQKSQLFKEQHHRNLEKSSYSDITEYFISLQLEIYIEPQVSKYITRIVQLTQKTNQFNLSTHRYEIVDIERMLDKDNFDLMAFHVKDRFGQYGLTGLCITQIENDTAHLDTWLLSCRVLGRNIEYAIMNFLIERISKKGLKRLEATYIPSAKNGQVAQFFDNSGFQKKQFSDEKILYFCEVKNYKPIDVNYIRIAGV